MVKKRSRIPIRVTHPDIASEWHPTNNDSVTPNDIVAGSNKRFWWKCPNGPDHEWQAIVVSRTRQSSGCPYCAGKKVSVTNSLAALFPDVATQLHPVLNNGVTAEQVTAGSHSKYWWKCPNGPDHEWKAAVANRTLQSSGCPCCAGRQVSVTNSLASRCPDIAAQLDPDLNDGMTADQITSACDKKLYWRCSVDQNHIWMARVANRTKKKRPAGCAICTGKQASVTNSLASLYPDIAAQLHPELNNGITADQIVAQSHSLYWWICPEGPDHIWEASPHNRAGIKKSGCPGCTGNKLSITNSLATLFPNVAAQLHPDMNNGVTADQIVAGSHSKYWWVCPEGPDHIWEASPHSRTGNDNGCPCCAGQQASVTNSLASLFPDIAAQLDPDQNDGMTADQITSATDKKFYWRCSVDQNHIWMARVADRTRIFKVTGCPYCKLVPRSAQEIGLAFELRLFLDFDIDDHKVQSGDSIYDCDIIIREHRLIVEFDGSYYHSGRDERDFNKSDALQKAEWTVLRVRELPLLPLTQMDVSIPRNMNMKPAADAVLLKIRDELNIPIDGLDNYLMATDPQNKKASERYIRKILKAA